MLPTRVLAGAGILLAGLGAGLVLFSPGPAQAQGADPCLGQLMLFGGNFCPRLYANANGQIISIAQNSALFSIFGTMYGGDGVTTFGLPNLQGRAPIHAGTLPGGSAYQQGEVGGTTSFSINIQNLPPHNHSATLNASDAPPTDSDPSGNVLAGANIYKAPPAGVAMGPSITIGNTGSGQPIDARSPYQVLRWCVAVEGIYCSRP